MSHHDSASLSCSRPALPVRLASHSLNTRSGRRRFLHSATAAGVAVAAWMPAAVSLSCMDSICSPVVTQTWRHTPGLLPALLDQKQERAAFGQPPGRPSTLQRMEAGLWCKVLDQPGMLTESCYNLSRLDEEGADRDKPEGATCWHHNTGRM